MHPVDTSFSIWIHLGPFKQPLADSTAITLHGFFTLASHHALQAFFSMTFVAVAHFALAA